MSYYRRNKKYYYRNYNKNISPLEMLLEIIAAGMYFIFKKIYQLILNMVKIIRGYKKPELTISNVIPSPEIPVSNTDAKYVLKSSLITDTEGKFLKILEEIVGDMYIIESQVLLSSIVNVKDSNGTYKNYTDFNRIKSKTIDFVLYNKDYTPYLAIELDDTSHKRWDRIRRDVFVDSVMNQVGLRILHVRVAGYYDVERLRGLVLGNNRQIAKPPQK